MKSEETGKQYNKIASWWIEQMKDSEYGLEYVRKALNFTKKNGKALDIGCGGNGRIINEIIKFNFNITGIDISSEMIRNAKTKYPGIKFIHADFYEWAASDTYDLIVAWDSIFHSPKNRQKKITEKMCRLLNDNGILLFTAGGIDGERRGEMNGVLFGYGSLSYFEYLEIIENQGCRIILMERDQFPDDHVVFICKKI